jgi:hypothetical protein
MKKIMLLSLVICSLNALDSIQDLETAIINSDLEYVEKAITGKAIDSDTKKYLLDISEKTIAHRDQAIHANHIKQRFYPDDIVYAALGIAGFALLASSIPKIENETINETHTFMTLAALAAGGFCLKYAYKRVVTIPKELEGLYVSALQIHGILHRIQTN